MKNPEILAPAGGCEELKSAVLHGANAVYFGVSSFNARIMADNFTTDNLAEWVNYCHFFGVKAYLTLNTVIKNEEIPQLVEVVNIATTANIDAFIVCDLATVEICKNVAPNIPLHFSTQFGVHNKEGAIYAKKLGAKRVILSRETPISEIERIKEAGLEIEVFVHGALCVSFSGNCYLSSSIDGNSGNRGRCKQPCRKKYLSNLSNTEGYFLSTNDLCLADKVNDLIDVGVDSFKIEGRLKSAEYVASTIKLYKKAINGDNYDLEIDDVKASFARTFTTAGYLTEKNDEIINADLQNSAGLYVGRIVKVQSLKNGLNKATFKTLRKLNVGDGVKFLRNKKEVGGATLSTDSVGGFSEAYLKANVVVGDEVCLTKPKSLRYEPTIKVKFNLTEYENGKYSLTLNSDKICHTTYFTVKNNEITQKSQIIGIKNVLQKGSMPFVVEGVDVSLKSDTFLPFSLINEERRRCFTEFKRLLVAPYDKLPPKSYKVDLSPCGGISNNIAVILSNEDCLEFALNSEVQVIYSPYDYDKIQNFFEKLKTFNKKVYLGLPTISFEKDMEVLYKTIEKYNTYICGLYGNNPFLDYIAQKYDLGIFKGYGANITNNISARSYPKWCAVTLSPELNLTEIENCDNNTFIYKLGYLPLMTLAHCPAKANGYTCANCPFDNNEELRYENKFDKLTIKRVKVSRCYFEVYSDRPIVVVGKTTNTHNVLLDLRQFSKKEIIEILKNSDHYVGRANYRYCRSGVL